MGGDSESPRILVFDLRKRVGVDPSIHMYSALYNDNCLLKWFCRDFHTIVVALFTIPLFCHPDQ